MTCQDVLDAPPYMCAEVSARKLHSQMRPAKRRVHRWGAIPKPARTDRPRDKRPSQCQDRHPRTGPRRGLRAPGRDLVRKAEGPGVLKSSCSMFGLRLMGVGTHCTKRENPAP